MYTYDLEKIKKELNNDIDLKNFYNNHIKQLVYIDFDEYIERKYIEYEDDFLEGKINGFRTSLNAKIRSSKSRLNKELEVYYPKKTRLINFENLLNKKALTIKNYFDYEIIYCICNLIISKKVNHSESEFITRINDYSSAFSMSGKKVMVNISNPQINNENNEEIYMSDKDVNNDTVGLYEGINASTIDKDILNSNTVQINDMTYLPIKSLDARSLKLVDHFVYDYSKTSLDLNINKNEYIEYSLKDIAKLLYPTSHITNAMKWSEKIINKITAMRYTIPSPTSENLKDTVTFSICEKQWDTDEHDNRYVRIFLSGYLKQQIKDNKITKLYKEKYDLITDGFTLIFVGFIQKNRINDLRRGLTKNVYSYEKLKKETRLPYKSRKKNMELVANTLKYLKEIDFLIADYISNEYYIETEYMLFTEKEIIEFNIQSELPS